MCCFDYLDSCSVRLEVCLSQAFLASFNNFNVISDHAIIFFELFHNILNRPNSIEPNTALPASSMTSLDEHIS